MKIGSIFLLLTLVLQTGCSKNNQSQIKSIKITSDFSIAIIPENLKDDFSNTNTLVDQDCMEHIKEVACFSEKEESTYDENCSKELITEEIISKINDAIILLPTFHQKVFCNINKLQIHKKIKSTAYATIATDANGVAIGNIIGIRVDAVKNEIKNDLLTWKEQLNFGLSKIDDPDYNISESGPKLHLAISNSNNPLLLEVLTHEITHLIDFMNHGNGEECVLYDESKEVECTSKEGTFSSISWPASYKYKSDYSVWPPKEIKELYPMLSQLCYYWCDENIPTELIFDLYNELNSKQLVTPYSVSSSPEDFAEASTVFFLQNYGYQFKISLNDKIIFDINEHIKSGKLDVKFNWLKNFYSNENLIYKVDPK